MSDRQRAECDGSQTQARSARHRRYSILALLLSSLFFACSSDHNQQTGPHASREIIVAAAANLVEAFTELGQRFTAETGIQVRFSFGATADLEKQIENGAPFDLFAAADVEHVDQLDAKGLLTPGTNKLYAQGRLVLWVPPGSSVRIERIEDIARAEVGRIAIAKPDLAPYGRATREALQALDLWPQVESKIIYGQNVSQTRQYAATGNAEVAFIPLALVKSGEGRSIEVDEHLHQPIKQALGIIKESRQQEAARRFADFVLSPQGQMILERYGYRRP